MLSNRNLLESRSLFFGGIKSNHFWIFALGAFSSSRPCGWNLHFRLQVLGWDPVELDSVGSLKDILDSWGVCDDGWWWMMDEDSVEDQDEDENGHNDIWKSKRFHCANSCLHKPDKLGLATGARHRSVIESQVDVFSPMINVNILYILNSHEILLSPAVTYHFSPIRIVPSCEECF